MFLAHGLARILWKPSGFLSLIYSTVVEKIKSWKKKLTSYQRSIYLNFEIKSFLRFFHWILFARARIVIFFSTSVFFFGVNIAGVWNSSSTNERFCYVDLQDFYHIFFQKTCGLTAFKILLSERARGLLAKSCNDIARARSLFARVWDGICESEAYICESVRYHLRECEIYLRECEILFAGERDIILRQCEILFATVWDVICESVGYYLRESEAYICER